ncbi:50S ribosomal protein L21 [Candidatus Parcubacteria bacterium]|nr:50S ribosomal protein L21 [Candidatus Parcubacteria bacterium]
MTEKTTKKAEKLAVIKTGGKQYLVQEGDILKIEKLSEDSIKDGKVTFEDVLMIADGDKVELGKPTVSGKTVSAEVVEEGRNKKISVIHYKSKSRYFKRNGHRQPFHKVKITKIA